MKDFQVCLVYLEACPHLEAVLNRKEPIFVPWSLDSNQHPIIMNVFNNLQSQSFSLNEPKSRVSCSTMIFIDTIQLRAGNLKLYLRTFTCPV